METSLEISRFQLTAESETSVFREKLRYDDPKFHLHIVQKKEVRTERPMIDSEKKERLAFYRAFTTTTAKGHVISTQYGDVNSFLWSYTMDTICKTLPHSFVHYFLSAYAPDEHMFITPMVPFSHGMKYLFVLTGILDLLICIDMLKLLLHFVVTGIVLKNPWNRCPDPDTYLDAFRNVTIQCFHIPEFVKLFDNRSYAVDEFTFVANEQKRLHFQVSQVEYYREHVYRVDFNYDAFMFMLTWTLLVAFHPLATKKHYWKILYMIQCVLIVVDILTFFYMCLKLYDAVRPQIATLNISELKIKDNSMWSSELDLLAESITAPPIVHVLTSRSSQEIDPAADSAAMVLSNAIYYIFRGLLDLKLRSYVETMLHTEIPVTQFNQHQWIFFYPIFWSQFYLGDVYSNLYFTLNFVLEFLVLAITCKCLVESVVYEWPKGKRWMFGIAIYVGGSVIAFFTSVDGRIVLWSYAKGISTMMEAVFLYMFYPVGRLVDDYTFFYGHTPTQLRVLSLRLVPFYYIFKFYSMMDSLWDEMEINNVGLWVQHYTWSWSLMVLPIALGVAYIVYKYLAVYRMTWNYIFRPHPKWGPKDFSERQMRKQFDSRHYIGSEAPKLLIRYLNGKRESKVYKIDVRYDFYRRSTVSPMAVRFGMHKASDA